MPLLVSALRIGNTPLYCARQGSNGYADPVDDLLVWRKGVAERPTLTDAEIGRVAFMRNTSPQKLLMAQTRVPKAVSELSGREGALDGLLEFAARPVAGWPPLLARVAVEVQAVHALFPELNPQPAPVVPSEDAASLAPVEDAAPAGFVPKRGVFQPEGGQWPHAENAPWSLAEIEAMRKMRDAKMSDGDIGKVVGVTRTTVANRIGRKGQRSAFDSVVKQFGNQQGRRR